MKKFIVLCAFLSAFCFADKAWAITTSESLFDAIGIYDCRIGNDDVIFITEKVSPDKAEGIFVINQGRAAENTHSFILQKTGKKWVIQSDTYSGRIKGTSNSHGFTGQISYFNKKKKFLFFYQKGEVRITKRPDETFAFHERYQQEIFSKVTVNTDIKYGQAFGYWTHNPYDNEPYVEVISRGIGTTLRDPSMLDLKMDIYQPAGDTMQNRPLVLLIHGGAFYIGTKQCPTMKILANTLAKRGYVVASIDYRMGFRLRGSDIERSGYRAVQDAHAALRFMAHNASLYKIDPNNVYVAGTSAGAIATLNLAFMDNDERPESVQSRKKSEDLGRIESSGNEYTEGFTVKAIVNMWGAVTDLSIIDKDENIPVLSIHGTADDIVPFAYDYPFQSALLINRLLMDKMYGSKSVSDRLNELGIKNELLAFDGLKHEPQTDKFDHMNHLMDTISTRLTRFYYNQISPEIIVPEKQLSVSADANLVPVYYEVEKGQTQWVSVVGGVKVAEQDGNLSVIWFKNHGRHELSIAAANIYNSWTQKKVNIQLK